MLIHNQFGGNLRRPSSRTNFFFVDTIFAGSPRAGLATVPTLEQRQGRIGTPIRNPYTGALYADGVIPADQITPFARQVLADLPAPTTGAASNNYENLPRSKFYNDKGDLKIDHTFNPGMTAFVRLSQRKLNNFEAPTIPGLSGATATPSAGQPQAAAASLTTSRRPRSSNFASRLAHRGGQDPAGLGGRTCRTSTGSRGCPRTRASPAGSTREHRGYAGSAGSRATRSSRTVHRQPALQLLDARRPPQPQGRLRVSKVDTEIEDFTRVRVDGYSGQFSRPAG